MYSLGFMVQGTVFRVHYSQFLVDGYGLRVSAEGLRVRVQGSGFRVQGFGLRFYLEYKYTHPPPPFVCPDLRYTTTPLSLFLCGS